MSVNNQMRGRAAKRKGDLFENLIDATCSYYKRMGIADIQKTPEPMRIIRPINRQKGTFEAYFEKQAQPDFKGVTHGGRAILFEAKRTETTSISQNRVTVEQMHNFNSASNLGAECFVMVSIQERHFYKVPWNVWEDMQLIYKKKSLNKKDLTEFEVPYRNGIINFLEGE